MTGKFLRYLRFPLLLGFSLSCAYAQEAVKWQDPSPHAVKFVHVANDVQLEVLDWGGKGRPLILLAGIGNTAHVFDVFAPMLADRYRVFAVTRRGFGASSAPSGGYGADQLGDDVLSVIAALELNKPVLVGHSIAGGELSSVGTRFPEKVAGLVYLDAANNYAFDDPGNRGLRGSMAELQKNLQELQKEPDNPKELIEELLQRTLPSFQRDLEEFQELKKISRPVAPARTAKDLASVSALGAWYKRTAGLVIPEAEIRASSVSATDGRIANARTPPKITQQVWAGVQKYRDIRAPVLAIFAIPKAISPYVDLSNVAMKSAAEDYSEWEAKINERQAKALEANTPSARVVRLSKASHYVFMSNEQDVLREIRLFVDSLQ